ncbi:Prolipoprotein diacylglyceryl transferase [BD1-7 clade bacterium]|uniref:Prolipoprotein diacylglyceryl transferase n=1 Tax=BD1-7 clade bacterium TaxID=2029982 RepID=A0A5S9QP15_9GAMM|nr:Prolipoprotein diacylglyceryl transferase [BD1-7 clade bacterium]CAA0121704.1 Prolipoprotein diacylglyceryl transferase [BD1-7 clade bacterium]
MQPLIPYFQTLQFKIPMPDFMPMDQIVLFGFGLLVGTGLIVGTQIAGTRAKRLGLKSSVMTEIYIWTAIGIVVGGHIGYGLFYHPQEYFANPKLFLDLTGGLSSFGGFIFCTIAILILLYKRKQPIWPYADCVTLGFSLGWFFGRMGCTVNHEHPGTPSNFFLARYCRPVEGWTWELPQWARLNPTDLRFSHCTENGSVVTSYADKVPVDYAGVVAVHDMGFYEALYALALFGVLKWLDRKPRFDGMFAMVLVFTYAPLRFFMDFLRPEAFNARYAGLTPAQWGCIVFMFAGIYGLYYLKKRGTITRNLSEPV